MLEFIVLSNLFPLLNISKLILKISRPFPTPPIQSSVRLIGNITLLLSKLWVGAHFVL